MAKAPFALGEQVELVIERLAFGGSGVGRYQGFVVFVPFSAPGDKLCAEITEIKKNFASARVVHVIEPGPERINARCPVFGQCGGCTWQHISYAEQLRQKQQIFEYMLHRSPQLKDAVVEDILASPQEWNYRNRVQLRAGQNKLGFFGRGTHDIIDTTTCPITDSGLNECFDSIRSRYSPDAKITKVELFKDERGEIHQTLNQAHGEEFGFSQVNSAQNAQLMDVLIDWMSELNPGWILDLYCGNGNFSFPLAQVFRESRFIGVELSAAAIARAKTRLKDSSLSERLEFHVDDVANFLRRHQWNDSTVVVIDPPRVGCEPHVLEALRESKAKIIYISCNPTTFVRDAEKLTRHQGYRLTRVRPLDMFPQTDHIELIGMFV